MGMLGRASIYEFGPFRLDPRERRLFRDDRPILLRTKVFDTLCALVRAHGRLVEKADLLQQVWPDSVVEEGNLAHNISALRKALGEPATGQEYIETVPGQGYRFVAQVRELQRRESGPLLESRLPLTKPPLANLIQRRSELERLDRCLERALSGTRQLVLVTGDAGIGKTTLVDAFAAQARGKVLLWFGYGQCLEHLGQGEAYMPVLEALGRMCREAAGEDLISFLARCAPTWLVQMPWLLNDAEIQALQHRVLGATRERMLREMVESVETLTAGKPLLLVLEDLHWADYSTMDLIAHLARRREPARLLVIGTYRPTGIGFQGHPLNAVMQELRGHGLCEELPLGALDEEGVEEYLSSRFSETTVPAGLARLLHRRTEGNPLFLSNVVDHWLPHGLLEKSLEELSLDLPDTVRGLLDRQLAMLRPEEQAILEAASVAGREFSVAAVAAALEQTEEEVEPACDALAKRGIFLDSCGRTNWPDGTVSARYAFVHDLHREILYDRLPPRRKARLHVRIGARLEAGYRAQARDLAAELAVHFVQGRDVPNAVRYLRYAAEHALARSAHREAAERLQEAMGMLGSLPESAERLSNELAVQATLAPALMAIHGWGSPEAHGAFLRARELSEKLEDPPHLPAVLVGLAAVFEVRGDYRRSQALLDEYVRRVADKRPGELLVESHDLLACSLFHQGAFARSIEHAGRAVTLYEPDRCYPFLASAGANPAVSAAGWAALGLWFLGFPDQAVAKAREALRRAEDHAYSLALAQTQAAVVHQYRREPEPVRQLAEAAINVAGKNGFPYWAAVGRILRGWGSAMQGEAKEGISEIREGVAGCRAAGVEMDRPYYQALLAEAYFRGAQPKQALSALDEALGMIRNTRTFFYEAELHRLRGNVLMEGGQAFFSDAEASFQEALRVARGQTARCLELRAAVSLAQLRRNQGRRREARRLLADVCAKFTEGFDTPDLHDAKAILEELRQEQGETRRAKLRGAGKLFILVAQACSWLDVTPDLF
jgi:DNA-binding winged helix-turn-helix (wHTH) protein/predicted ATPase